MKFTSSLSTLLVVLPLLVLETSAAPFNFFGNDNGNDNKGIGGLFGGKDNNGQSKKNNSTAGAGAGAAKAGGDPQTSLTLDPSVIGPNLAQNGLASAEPGQAASLTSVDNFINFCIGKTITNGLQVQAGSCNSVPMGDIPAKTAQPSAKFSFPTNLANVGENTAFTVTMNIAGMQTGAFTNPNTNYFGAPQQLNAQGQIVGHSHFVIQAIDSITSAATPDPNVFAFFQGLNAAAAGGVLSASVSKGLPAGTYRIFSINTAANHQPVIGPVAQHGSFDDAVYFTVGAKAASDALTAIGANGAAAGAGNATAAAAPAAAAPAAASAAAAPAAASAAAAPAAASAAAASAAPAKAAAAPAKAAAAPAAASPAPAKVAAAPAASAPAKAGRRSFSLARN